MLASCSSSLRKILEGMSGVKALWLSSAATNEHHLSGWLACDFAAQSNAIQRVEQVYGVGECKQQFFFGRTGGTSLSLLVYDPDEIRDLPPGFCEIGFLNDMSETALVDGCLAKIEMLECDIAQGLNLLGCGEHAKAQDLVARSVCLLKGILTCMFWRDLDVPVSFLPSGPWRALQIALDDMPIAIPQRCAELSKLTQATLGLLGAQFGGTAVQIDLPSWYEDKQASVYNRHRFFPVSIGRQVAGLLNTVPQCQITEMGAGTGRFSLSILDFGTPHGFNLYDASQAMLDQLQANLAERFGDQVHIGFGTLDGLSDVPGAIDILLEHEVFFLHPNPDRLARALDKAVQTDGIIMRLERSTQMHQVPQAFTAAFDRQVAAGLGSPVGFVGEGCAAAMDSALGVLGFETQRYNLKHFCRTVTHQALYDARRDRAFPYLTYVPEAVLTVALRTLAASDDVPDHVFEESYDLAISFRTSQVQASRISAVLTAAFVLVPE